MEIKPIELGKLRNAPTNLLLILFIGAIGVQTNSCSDPEYLEPPLPSSDSGDAAVSSSFGEASSSSGAVEPGSSSSREASSNSGAVEPGSSSYLVPSSSSVVLNSSSEEPPPPSSSSFYEPSSSSATTSSSSSVLSSSSAPPSSSSAEPSSSSNIGGSGLCAGFVDGTMREHYGKDKPQFCDERDGKKYVYVTIGEQVWMAENLNYDATNSRCYGDNTGGDSQNRCGTYGRLYNWATAMNGAKSSETTPSGVQGVCPEGWHLPSDAEWDALMTAVGGSSTGTLLKANSSLWTANSGSDNHGFSALPGGLGYGVSFDRVGSSGGWWSATHNGTGSSYALFRAMDSNANVTKSYYDKSVQFSVRCLRD